MYFGRRRQVLGREVTLSNFEVELREGDSLACFFAEQISSIPLGGHF
jgi:hypothetical protein